MYDFVVIGSGVSGGRIAYELQKGGARCLLLEAGPAFDRTSFPKDELAYTTEMFWGGGVEVTRDGSIGLMRGRCLGGTSVVNQADLSRFDHYALDDWRDRTGIDFLSVDGLTPEYDALDAEVIASEIPEEFWGRNARLWTSAMDRLGYGWQKILRAQSDCRWDKGSDCIVCLGGCPRDSKQSTLVAQIPAAVRLGLEVECDWTAEAIEDRGDSVAVHGVQHGRSVEARGRHAVLACGSLGNVRLLALSGFDAELPALGKGFACHPQFMTFGVFDDPVDAHKGPFQSVESHDPRLREAGIKIENVFGPPIAVAMLLEGWGREHLQQMKLYRHLSCLEVAVRDENSGVIRVSRNGRVVVEKSLTAQDSARRRHGMDLAADLHHAAGAKRVIFSDTVFGLHLMGGCAIGTDPQTSVVGPDFTVHGHPNLFAADSSIFPSAPGQNPSYTIMALSRMAAREMLQR
ncbi:MAG: GMC family oxidoreductase [Acidimicrobiales bacterium]|nr:MAG: GMC family oxidoreductase [Acidimicrobiales bacterium]